MVLAQAVRIDMKEALNIRPGDLIEWLRPYNGSDICEYEEMWSLTMKKYVPIGKLALCIHVDDDVYSWLVDGRVFNADYIPGTFPMPRQVEET